MKGTVPQCTGFRVYERLNQIQSVQRLGQGSISFRTRIPAEKWQRGSINSIFMEFFNRETTICKQNVSKLPRSATLITTLCDFLLQNSFCKQPVFHYCKGLCSLGGRSSRNCNTRHGQREGDA
ncbi:unnamed protein product [Sphagnum jensenii]|uniref:Uncharacterized protein n=1 Tax=Sphagnum jensenii TaxID=128206 RepID=A0ABP0X991_9BRYO